MTEDEYERGCKEYLVIDDQKRLEFRKADREPGWHTIMKAKARGFSEAGAESSELLRGILKKRPVSFHALFSAYL